jgi:hypothetical protein
MSAILPAYTARVRGAVAAASLANQSLRILRAIASVLVFGALLCAWQPAPGSLQQGPKLVGNGAVGQSLQGYSVALSADGNTLIIGGPGDNVNTGAAWVFTRNDGAWIQQGSKLIGNGAVGSAMQGTLVALSADGNTAIVSGSGDDTNVGAAWVFTRYDGVWTQQGSKLIGNGAVGQSLQGTSVALSADGNTLIVGGPGDDANAGAAWVFTRSSGVWTQQGSKLSGTGAVGNAFQGLSIALSGDGTTAIVGGPDDKSNTGAAWIFTQSGGVWTQQGSKLFGSGAVGAAHQGYSVALSADGNTAIESGLADNANTGATWIFTQSGGVWTQQGSKLVGNGAVGKAFQGAFIALSADGNTAIVGGGRDNSDIGAAWVFAQSGGVWTQQGSKLVGTGTVGSPIYQGISVALSGDGDTAIVGGDGDNSNVGAVWVFVSPIVGIFTATPTAGQAPLAVTFRTSGLPLPATYTINFGDGTTGALTQGSCTGFSHIGGEGDIRCAGSASHTYTSAGTDTAKLLNASAVTLGTVTITVGDTRVAQPLVGSTPPSASPPVSISTPGRHSLGQ